MALTYHDRGEAKSGTRWSVLSGSVHIGSINKTMQSIMAKDHEQWDWWLESHHGPPGYQHHGSGETLDEAKQQLERNWRMWCEAAGCPRTSPFAGERLSPPTNGRHQTTLPQ